jgi:hypothetical protein
MLDPPLDGALENKLKIEVLDGLTDEVGAVALVPVPPIGCKLLGEAIGVEETGVLIGVLIGVGNTFAGCEMPCWISALICFCEIAWPTGTAFTFSVDGTNGVLGPVGVAVRVPGVTVGVPVQNGSVGLGVMPGN